MLSAGIFSAFAAARAARRRGLPSGSPPLRAATVISLMSLVNIFPRRASAAPFLCLMVAHRECPDMAVFPFQNDSLPSTDGKHRVHPSADPSTEGSADGFIRLFRAQKCYHNYAPYAIAARRCQQLRNARWGKRSTAAWEAFGGLRRRCRRPGPIFGGDFFEVRRHGRGELAREEENARGKAKDWRRRIISSSPRGSVPTG